MGKVYDSEDLGIHPLPLSDGVAGCFYRLGVSRGPNFIVDEIEERVFVRVGVISKPQGVYHIYKEVKVQW